MALDELATLGGVSAARVMELIADRAIPGPIYSVWPNDVFWSPVGGQHGNVPKGSPAHWYSPAAAWWIRRSDGLTPAEAAAAFETRFISEFVTQLAAEPYGHLGYPQAYTDANFDLVAAKTAARSEWQDWLDGGYGVCLRHATAYHAITKTCRRATVLAMTDSGKAKVLLPAERETLLTILEDLDAVMLPFAPYQRPNGTPGLWLDTILLQYGFGTTREAAISDAAHTPFRLCS